MANLPVAPGGQETRILVKIGQDLNRISRDDGAPSQFLKSGLVAVRVVLEKVQRPLGTRNIKERYRGLRGARAMHEQNEHKRNTKRLPGIPKASYENTQAEHGNPATLREDAKHCCRTGDETLQENT